MSNQIVFLKDCPQKKKEARIVFQETDETFERQMTFACNTKKRTSAALSRSLLEGCCERLTHLDLIGRTERLRQVLEEIYRYRSNKFKLKFCLFQKLSQMHVCNTFNIGIGIERIKRYHHLGIVVVDGLQITKLPLLYLFI